MPIVMRRGDTPDWDITVKEPDGTTPFDLAGCDVWLTAKRKIGDADADAIFQLSTADGSIVITDAANGLCTATPAASDTSGLTADVQGIYDVQVRTLTNHTYTVIPQDSIYIARDITRA